MPNHYTVGIVLCGADDFDAYEWNDKHAESDLCEIVRPMPDALRDVHVGGCTIAGQRFERWLERDGERTPIDADEYRRAYGYADHREFALDRWGTKWGAYSPRAYDLGGDSSPVLVKFQCAWNAPHGACMRDIIDWLAKTEGFDTAYAWGFDPTDDSLEILDPSG